ncbi:hypothetical protein MVEG_10632 [Podila verticillata NRRL 6337]|nr:hypothetical protein MVEG_10632 [Podila verticillata NRRL 6337]
MPAPDPINITSLTLSVSSLKNATSKPPSSPSTPALPLLTNTPMDPPLSTGVLNTLSVADPFINACNTSNTSDTTCPLPSPISPHDWWDMDLPGQHNADKKPTSNEIAQANPVPKHIKTCSSSSSSFCPRPSSSSQISPVHIPAPFQTKAHDSTLLETFDKKPLQQQEQVVPSIFDNHPPLTILTSRASTPSSPTPELERVFVHDQEKNSITVGTTTNTLNSFHTASESIESDTALEKTNAPSSTVTTTITTTASQVISHSSSAPSLQATRSTTYSHSKTGSNPLLKNHFSSPSQPLSFINNNNNMATPSTSPMSTPNLSGQSIFNNSTSSEPLSPGSDSNMNNASSTTVTNTTGSTTTSSSLTTMTSTTHSPMGVSSGISDAKLKRFLEHNQRLREQLEMRRISVSEAGQCLIKYVTNTKDSLLPMLWGNPASDPFSKQTKACCSIS